MTATPQDIRCALIARQEICILDVREEAQFALGHPLFAAQLPLRRVSVEAEWRIPRKDTRIVVYDDAEGLAEQAVEELKKLGFTNVALLEGGLKAWKDAGYQLFEDVNSYSKAFGELVEHRRHTPSLPAQDVQALIDQKADVAILDARRFDEYSTMSIPTGRSCPGAELVLRAPVAAPSPDTTIIVNCAGRTRSIIGTQSLINAGLPNKIYALRNGTIGWTLAGQKLDTGKQELVSEIPETATIAARQRALEVSYRAGVRHITFAEFSYLRADTSRTLYCFDVRLPSDFIEGHIPGFRNAQGGQLVQETDHFAPVRGARIVLADPLRSRADMSASWLAQMGWDVCVLDTDTYSGPLEKGSDGAPPARGPEGRYKRPYEGTDNKQAAMQAYLDWEYGLVYQLAKEDTHGFFVI